MTLLKLALLGLSIAWLVRYGDNPNRKWAVAELLLAVALLAWLTLA